jgi:hypothetical protein
MCTDADEISHALVDIVIDNSFHAAYAITLHGEHGREDGGADA